MDNIIKYGSISQIPLYNCTGLAPEQWSQRDGVSRPMASIFSIIYGTTANLLYIPLLTVMLESSLFKMSCFKIMVLLGIVDMLALWINSILTGYLAIKGAVYCTYPNLIYISGMIALFLWCSACLLAMLLVVNRLLDLTKPHWNMFIFEGRRTYLILTIPIIYGLYFFWFTPPAIFTSKYFAWFFDPLIFPNRTLEYSNIPHNINNVVVVAVTCLLYSSLCCTLGGKFRDVPSSRARTLSTQIFIQSSLICVFNQIGSLIYVIMNFMPVPVWLIMTGHLMWQLIHGVPVIIYLCLNRTIRNGLFKKIGVKASQINSSF